MRYLSSLLAFATLLVVPLLPAQARSAEVGTALAPASAELTETDLGAFLNDFFERELAPHEVPGAGVVVVRDGLVLAAGGYGYADLERGTPVVAESTLFPAQSVSKLFAATAVMQVFERGLVDLDADVRRYLGEVPVDSSFDQPVTLAHLLTHTAGFDDSYIGFLPRTPEDLVTVPEFLTRHRRKVIFEPGTVHAYTNYGSLLARHVVETVTGTRYEDYLVEEMLRPLRMSQSCPLPPPPEWADRVATGYLPAGDGVESTRSAFPDGLVRFRTSTGTVASTVVDMARFMIAHLEGGAVEGGRILESETVELMHRQQFAQHPELPGATYGFFETYSGGERGIFHFGSGFGYGTMLYLLPEHRVGLYIAHSNSAARIAEALMTAFLKRYFNRSEPPADVFRTKPLDRDATDFAGFYEQARRPESTFEKLPLGLMQAQLRAVDFQTLANDQVVPRQWRRSGLLMFQRSDGRGFVAFEENAEGRPTLASIWDNEFPQLLVLERVPWYDSTPALLVRVAWFTLVFLLIVAGYPIVAWFRRRRSSRREAQEGRLVTGSIVGASTLNLAFLAGMVWIFAGRQFFYSVSPAMVAIFCLPLLGLVFTGLALAGTVRGHARRPAGRAARVLRVVVLGTLVLFPLFLWRWNLLGFHF